MNEAFKRKVEAAFGNKPGELEHLYVDTQGELRDRHIKDMFRTLFNGDDLDDIFTNNFTVYFNALKHVFLPTAQEPTPDVFKNAALARQWVTQTFGLLYVGRIPIDDPVLQNDLFAECHYEARLRSFSACSSAVHYCYAPYELHATLLAVVNLYREIAKEYHTELLSRS